MNQSSYFLVSAILFLLTAVHQAREVLVEYGSSWHYHNGEGLFDPTWKDFDFDETKWETGVAPFIYGHYRGNTIIEHKERPRPITTYYRTSFHLEDPDDIELLECFIRADDAPVIYINGQFCSSINIAKYRTYTPNMLADKVVPKYRAPKRQRYKKAIAGLLRKGRNTVAIEVHQRKNTSSDLLMDFQLSFTKKGTKEVELFSESEEWAYFDQEEFPGEEWASLEYDDSSWKKGAGTLGYDNKQIATTTNSRYSVDDPAATIWFRKTFEIDGTLNIKYLNLEYIADDGAVFYLNGHEVQRVNMPAGFIDHRTCAPLSIRYSYERERVYLNIPADHLVLGKNVIAVSVHQNRLDSPDLAFAMGLRAEYLPGDASFVAVKVKENNKPVDITNATALKESEAGDWLATSNDFMEKAIVSHAAGKLKAAVHSYYASKWAEVFSRYTTIFSPELKDYLLDASQVGISQEFFDLHSPKDDHRKVYQIIADLYADQKVAFQKFPRLALAIGLVYDQSAPPHWPHYQVANHILPRVLPSPREAMAFWVKTDEEGKSLHSLKDLSVEELKFVVDTPASLAELEEAQTLRVRLGSFGELYSGINYVHERLHQNLYTWPHQSYVLPKIKEMGGICVDQAYYTVQVAKAHGVPAMMVSGAGNNGNHAWVGFLDKRGRWDFKVGRYEEAKYVTGITFDPQTWEQPTDHQLAMMSERFRISPKFRISRVHTVFAEEYLKRDKTAAAIKAAEMAIEAESRNFSAWEILIRAKKAAAVSVKDLDDLYEKGAKAFSRYADLESEFLRRLGSSYEAQDRMTEADKLRAKIIARNRRERPDLALEEAKSILEEAMINDALEDQVELYKKQISRLKDAGLIAYYGLTNQFLQHLVGEDRKDLAKSALEYTERRMDVKEGSQLEQALYRWRRKVEG